jgi:hypothetical protein
LFVGECAFRVEEGREGVRDEHESKGFAGRFGAGLPRWSLSRQRARPADRVTFMAVTRGKKPDLLRDGC